MLSTIIHCFTNKKKHIFISKYVHTLIYYYFFRLKRRRLHAEKGQASKKLVEDMDDQIENLTSNVNYFAGEIYFPSYFTQMFSEDLDAWEKIYLFYLVFAFTIYKIHYICWVI